MHVRTDYATTRWRGMNFTGTASALQSNGGLLGRNGPVSGPSCYTRIHCEVIASLCSTLSLQDLRMILTLPL
jgi:hypothetical protein